MVLDEGAGLSSAQQQYDATSIINAVRGKVGLWRLIPNPADWKVTPKLPDSFSTGGTTISRTSAHSSARSRRWRRRSG